MTKQIIDIGAAPNDGSGDSLRVGGQIINANFDELYDELSRPGTTTVTASATIADNTRIQHVNSALATTQTLPFVTTSIGRSVTIRNINTGVVTIDGNGSDAIVDPVLGSVLTFLLFNIYEQVTLYSDGARWYVVSKQLRKHIARAYHNASLSVATATVTPVPMNLQQFATGLTFTSGNDEPYTINRAGRYRMTGKATLSLNTGIQLVAYLYRNGSAVWEDRKASGGASQITQPTVDTILDLAAGDTIGLRVWHNQGSNVSLQSGFTRPELIIQEVD